MDNRGGKRPGAGRKPVDGHLTPVMAAKKRIVDLLPALIDLEFSLANGVEALSDKGIVYTTIPDRNAIEYLINRVMGKPTEPIELTGADGAPIEMSIRKLTDDELDAELEQTEAFKRGET